MLLICSFDLRKRLFLFYFLYEISIFTGMSGAKCHDCSLNFTTLEKAPNNFLDTLFKEIEKQYNALNKPHLLVQAAWKEYFRKFLLNHTVKEYIGIITKPRGVRTKETGADTESDNDE
jgi:hypothetical protein